MDVSCPACAARYTADDEKLRGKTARMRCKACNTAWIVSGAPAGSAPISTPPVEPVVPPVFGAGLPSGESTDVAASSKRAAVVKRGAEREKRDLFAAREPE